MPSSEGDTIIDPYHNPSILKKGGHSLGGRSTRDPNGRLLICSALWKATLSSRFEYLALVRVRSPPTRVMQQKYCPIQTILNYSKAAFEGRMPFWLDGRWPLLKEEAVTHAAALRDYEKLAPEARPRSRLDLLSIDQVKTMYKAGRILPQVHKRRENGAAKTKTSQPGSNDRGSSTGAGGQNAGAPVDGRLETPTAGQTDAEAEDVAEGSAENEPFDLFTKFEARSKKDGVSKHDTILIDGDDMFNHFIETELPRAGTLATGARSATKFVSDDDGGNEEGDQTMSGVHEYFAIWFIKWEHVPPFFRAGIEALHKTNKLTEDMQILH